MARRLLFAALLVLAAELAAPYLAGGRNDRFHIEVVRGAYRRLRNAPRRPAWLLVGDSSANSDVNPDELSRALGGVYWIRVGTVGDMTTAQTLSLVEDYIARRGKPLGVVAAHCFPAWYIRPRPPELFIEKLSKASALVRLGEAVAEELGAPTLEGVLEQAEGPRSRYWRRFLDEIPPESRGAAQALSDLSRREGFPLVFLETPVRRGVISPEERPAREKVREMLRALGHPLLIVDEEAAPEDMVDEMHLTRAARKAYTRRLAQSLSAAGFFTPKARPLISAAP